MLCGGTILHIENALYFSKSNRNLLSFKYIRLNEYHIETKDDEDIEYLCITQPNWDKKSVMEKPKTFFSGLYYTYISTIEVHAIVNQKFTNDNKFIIWQ